jgi:tripartite-type tricarboxylate transporter receptor subunit TctC
MRTTSALRTLLAALGASLLTAAGAASALAGESAGAAAAYPTRPIRIVIPFTAGSASDLLARLVGPKLTDAWGQQVVVDNRPSAGGTVAGSIVATSTPDGHTLMVSSSAFAGSAALFTKLPYDTVRDLSGVSLVASNPLVLIVGPALGVRSVKDLIALARQKPGQLNYASSGIGSGTHFGAELFRQTAGIDVVHIPYKGTPETVTDAMTGRVHYAMPPILPTIPLVREGRVLALAVTTRDRAPMLPDVPTIAEAALPGYEYDGWFGFIASSRTPRPVVDKLAREIARIVELPDVKERIAHMGGRARSTSPAEFDRLIRSEIATRGKVFRAAGVRPE